MIDDGSINGSQYLEHSNIIVISLCDDFSSNLRLSQGGIIKCDIYIYIFAPAAGLLCIC